MLESNPVESRQDIPASSPIGFEDGQSVADTCLSWQLTTSLTAFVKDAYGWISPITCSDPSRGPQRSWLPTSTNDTVSSYSARESKTFPPRSASFCFFDPSSLGTRISIFWGYIFVNSAIVESLRCFHSKIDGRLADPRCRKRLHLLCVYENQKSNFYAMLCHCNSWKLKKLL